MRCEVFAYQEISSLPETAEDGLGPCESVERTGIAPIEVEFEKAGGSSRQEGISFDIIFHGGEEFAG